MLYDAVHMMRWLWGLCWFVCSSVQGADGHCTFQLQACQMACSCYNLCAPNLHACTLISIPCRDPSCPTGAQQGEVLHMTVESYSWEAHLAKCSCTCPQLPGKRVHVYVDAKGPHGIDFERGCRCGCVWVCIEASLCGWCLHWSSECADVGAAVL